MVNHDLFLNQLMSQLKRTQTLPIETDARTIQTFPKSGFSLLLGVPCSFHHQTHAVPSSSQLAQNAVFMIVDAKIPFQTLLILSLRRQRFRLRPLLQQRLCFM